MTRSRASAAVAVLMGLSLLGLGYEASVGGPSAQVRGGLTVAGHGPERPVIEALAKAFEKAYPGAYVDILWHRNVKAVDLVKADEADIAVTGQEERGLIATPIGWDGIAIVTNFANPIQEISRREVAELFTGRIRRWSQLNGPDRMVKPLLRPPDQNIDVGFRRSLGINGEIPETAETVRSDQHALSKVSGDDTAVTYMSLRAALDARRDGIPIRILLVDRVDPEWPTVADGRYSLRRPVLLLARQTSDPVTKAFLTFAQSNAARRIVAEMFVPYESPSTDMRKATGDFLS